MIAKKSSDIGGDQFVEMTPATPYELSAENQADKAAVLDLETRYRAVFGSSHDAFLIADASGQYVEANESAAALLGFSRTVLTTMSMDELHARPEWTAEDRLRFVKDGRWDGLMSVRSQSGETVPVYARLSLIQLSDCALYLTALSQTSPIDQNVTTLAATSEKPSLLERGIGLLSMFFLLVTILLLAGGALAVYAGFRFPAVR